MGGCLGCDGRLDFYLGQICKIHREAGFCGPRTHWQRKLLEYAPVRMVVRLVKHMC